MKLITRWQNSAGERVRIAFNLKKINYEYLPISSLTAGEYQRINPQGLLPTLITDNGAAIAQSGAILQFIEETLDGPSLLPQDPILRAQSRSFAGLITSEIHALTITRIRKHLGNNIGNWVHHWHEVGLTALEETLRNREVETMFCFTNEPGWAELHLVPQLANARRFGVELSPYPRLLQVEHRCNQLLAFIDAKPENQPDFPKS